MKLEETSMYYVKVVCEGKVIAICNPFTTQEALKEDLENNGWRHSFLHFSKKLKNGKEATATIEPFNKLPD